MSLNMVEFMDRMLLCTLNCVLSACKTTFPSSNQNSGHLVVTAAGASSSARFRLVAGSSTDMMAQNSTAGMNYG